ncbi:transporter [Ganoderma sinense ZZ0214-1]|uniref:ferric-chelate reductase (NADPH) n=1 Tax=Ganoderma sinense ZZ0214-1 TaxID=1077348 RepID=A0A2G8S0E0_9APHY|nr:transporter [Ganoderma sinense ZZ0214-1]
MGLVLSILEPSLSGRAGPQGLNASVAFWTDIAIVCVAGLAFILTLPRAVARLGPGGGWSNGHYFRSRGRARPAKIIQRDSVSSQRYLMGDVRTEVEINIDTYPPPPATSDSVPITRKPVHVKACQARFPFVMRAVRTPTIGRVRLGGVMICALYFGVLLYATLHKSSVFKDPRRAGWVAISQIPVVYVLATKNNVLCVAWGTAYDRISFHMPAAIPYAIAGTVFYGLDRILRILKTRIVTATITTIPEMYSTQLAIPQINAGWRAGQFVRIRVLSGGSGVRGWLVSHPFTIACGGIGEGGAPYGLTLLIKNSGRWTKRLYDVSMAKQRASDLTTTIQVKVLIEGPYGGFGYTLPHSFFGALYVVGGAGISFGLAGIQEAVQHAQAGTSTLRVVDLVWSVRHPDCLVPLLPTFSSLLAQAAAANLKLGISVFYTRAVTLDHEFKDYVLPMDLRLEPGHRRLQNMVQDVVDRTLRTIERGEELRGVFIGTCGPANLSDPIREVIGDLDCTGLSSRVGGIELHEEIFALD